MHDQHAALSQAPANQRITQQRQQATPARLMAASVAPTARVRMNLDMGPSNRLTDRVWVLDGRLAGAWPAGQPQPLTSQPPPAPVARPAGPMGEPGLGGLLLSFGDALDGQLLAQPGMLVVHVLPPFTGYGCGSRLAWLARPGRAGSWERWRPD